MYVVGIHLFPFFSKRLDSNRLAAPLPQTLGEIVLAASSDNIPQPTHLIMCVRTMPLLIRIYISHMLLICDNFRTPSHLQSITSTIAAQNSSTFFSGLAWKRKSVELAGGSLSDTTFWDSFGGLSESRRLSFGYTKTNTWVKSVLVAGGTRISL